MFIKSKADNDIPANTIAVNNFFAHCIKEIDIKRYGNELQILPTDKSRDIYRYSDAVKTFQETFCLTKNLLLFLPIAIGDLIQITMYQIEQIQICQIEQQNSKM